jgi:glycosyltransferase involved in cell wall biosynthesis
VRVGALMKSPSVPCHGVWPSVGVVVTTGDRPNLVRRALDSVLAQDFPGPLRVVVVYDDAVPDWSLARSGVRPVLVLENWRRPGLSGARNTGILATADCDWVALCNDDDTWAPDKLTAQVSAVLARRGSQFGSCGAEVEYDGRRTPRLVGRGAAGRFRTSAARTVTLETVSRGRARTLTPSGFLARHDALARSPRCGGVGLLDELGPPGAAEWDLLMRAARQAPIVHVNKPLVRVLWRQPELDPAGQLRVLRWMQTRHQEIRDERRPAARNLAEIACWAAAAGDRKESWACARAALRASRREPMALLALAAAAGLARGRRLCRALRRDHLIRT